MSRKVSQSCQNEHDTKVSEIHRLASLLTTSLISVGQIRPDSAIDPTLREQAIGVSQELEFLCNSPIYLQDDTWLELVSETLKKLDRDRRMIDKSLALNSLNIPKIKRILSKFEPLRVHIQSWSLFVGGVSPGGPLQRPEQMLFRLKY